jgi:hypothetical protein
MAVAARQELGLDELAPLCPWAFAERRGIAVWSPEDLALDASDLAQLTVVDPDSWSGATVRLGSLAGIIVNSAHPKGRQTNTVMHEMSHILLRHVPSHVEVSETGLLLLSDYPQDVEDEANWLAGAMLLPRAALLLHRGRGASVLEIATGFGVSDELCTWRIRMTAIDRQLGIGRRSPFS